MNEDPISLGKLAYACGVYDAMTGFGSAFQKFQHRVNHTPDLTDPDHRLALLEWLNAWGCRHLSLACHPDVSKQLAVWHKFAGGQLPGSDESLAEMTVAVLEKFADLFDHLSSLPAREGVRNGHRFPISFGPTAASKTLFALRPHVFVAWDEAIRQEFVADDSGASYVGYLKRVRGQLTEITKRYSRHKIDLENLPERLDRGESTAAQLIGEYYWITVTRKVKPPGPKTLTEWLAWR